uniref:Uncharacterized protein n=1 Tax=Avena sativa TaxID=4498 RepID=A0ACD5US67_AVESA
MLSLSKVAPTNSRSGKPNSHSHLAPQPAKPPETRAQPATTTTTPVPGSQTKTQTPPTRGHAPLPPPLLTSQSDPSANDAVHPSPAKQSRSASMDPAYDELERRSRYLSSLVRRTRLADPPQPEPEPEQEPKLKLELKPAVEPKPAAEPSGGEAKGGKTEVKEREAKGKGGANGEERKVAVRVRAADMPLPLQRRAIWIAREVVLATPRLESKRLALALKKDFDTTYGPAWHCIVGTSFGSYVTHSLGGFLYFSIDKAYILLFRTTVEPLSHP